MDSDQLKSVVATNVNEEAVILRGCTTSELTGASLMSTIVVLPIFMILGVLFGKFMIAMGLGMVANFAAIYGIATLMQQMKRGRPEGYFNHWMMLIGKKVGMVHPPFVVHDGPMSIFRTKQVVLIDKHLKKKLDR